MPKRLRRLIPRLLAVAILAISVSALGAYRSGNVYTGSVSQSQSWIGIWYTSNGSTQVGSIDPKFTKGGTFTPDKVSVSFAGSGNYQASGELKISHSNGVTHSISLATTANGSTSLNGTLWEAASAFSIVLTENISSGKVTFKNS
ncbi:MAG: hypothetical protein LBK75_00880 [Oscillospiraceae bacterium]|jgi:hypothetical protein|nr:hypothetical protein [Oscillospiraceae bacterium]